MLFIGMPFQDKEVFFFLHLITDITRRTDQLGLFPEPFPQRFCAGQCITGKHHCWYSKSFVPVLKYY